MLDSSLEKDTPDTFTNAITQSKPSPKMPSPSRFAPNFICPAFVRKQFPFENRRAFEIQHRLALMRGVKELVEHHGCDVPSDGFEKSARNGFMDVQLTDPLGNPVILEATGSDWVKVQKIVQACLYRPFDSTDNCAGLGLRNE